MAEINQSPEQQLGLPEDLRAWVGEAQLVRFVFEALHTVEEDDDHWLGGKKLPSGSPRTLLTVLTYSYAIGLYSSEEIEHQIKSDDQLGYLSARTCPPASSLRQFRRHGRDFLLRSLSRLFLLAWESGRPSTLPQAFGHGSRPDLELRRDLEVLCERAAEHRIEESILADTMALDL